MATVPKYKLILFIKWDLDATLWKIKMKVFQLNSVIAKSKEPMDLLSYIRNSLYSFNEFVITTIANSIYTCFLSPDYNFC